MNIDRVRARMLELALTQAELAAACDVDVRTTQRWLAGQRVSVADAERVAIALGVGTADLFAGVPRDAEQLIPDSVRSVLRLVSAREGDFAQALRLAMEHYEELTRSVWISAHPAHGYVARVSMMDLPRHGFVQLRLRLASPDTSVLARAQVGRRFGYAMGRIRVRAGHAQMLEPFQTHSMVATLTTEQELLCHVWAAYPPARSAMTPQIRLLGTRSASQSSWNAPRACRSPWSCQTS
jgi:transcriptional regulator with XRE-family HTH domain